jgi:hypothetical protein
MLKTKFINFLAKLLFVDFLKLTHHHINALNTHSKSPTFPEGAQLKGDYSRLFSQAFCAQLCPHPES